MEWTQKPCPYLKTLLRQVQNTEQTQEIRLSEEMPDIARVVCSRGQCVLRSKERRGESMSAAGGVSASVLYLPEDGSSPGSVEVWIPFRLTWNLPKMQREGTMRCQCLLQSIDARMLSARKIMVRASVSVLAEVFEPTDEPISLPEEVPEGLQLLQKTYPALLPREAGEKLFELEDDLKLDGVKELFASEMTLQLNEQSIAADRLVLRGQGQVHCVYLGDDGEIHAARQYVPFAQFVQLDREYDKEADADTMVALSSLETELSEDGVHIRYGLNAQYLVWERTLLQITEDAYFPMHAVQLSTQDLALPMQLDDRTEDVPLVCGACEGKLLDVTFLPSHPTQYREGEEVHVSVGGAFQMLYEDALGELQSSVENLAEELSLPVAADAQLHSILRSVASAEDGTLAQLQIGLQTVSTQSIPMLTAISIGEKEAADEDRPSLILRRMDAQSLWELAKENGSTVEDIRKANSLAQEPEQGQMLLIPIP